MHETEEHADRVGSRESITFATCALPLVTGIVLLLRGYVLEQFNQLLIGGLLVALGYWFIRKYGLRATRTQRTLGTLYCLSFAELGLILDLVNSPGRYHAYARHQLPPLSTAEEQFLVLALGLNLLAILSLVVHWRRLQVRQGR